MKSTLLYPPIALTRNFFCETVPLIPTKQILKHGKNKSIFFYLKLNIKFVVMFVPEVPWFIGWEIKNAIFNCDNLFSNK